jgi:hypothetical protein
VAVTHDIGAAGRSDHCVLLRDGNLTTEGAPTAVLPYASLHTASAHFT